MDLYAYEKKITGRVVDGGWINQENTLQLLKKIREQEAIIDTLRGALNRERAYVKRLEAGWRWFQDQGADALSRMTNRRTKVATLMRKIALGAVPAEAEKGD